MTIMKIADDAYFVTSYSEQTIARLDPLVTNLPVAIEDGIEDVDEDIDDPVAETSD